MSPTATSWWFDDTALCVPLFAPLGVIRFCPERLVDIFGCLPASPQMFPRITTYDVEDIRGFFLQMSINQGRTMYQLFMELMTGRIVPMELTRSCVCQAVATCPF
jgi:hypothetical protein